MKIEAYVLVQPGVEPCVSSKPWSINGCPEAKWYRMEAEVPDPIPFVDVAARAAALAPQGKEDGK